MKFLVLIWAVFLMFSITASDPITDTNSTTEWYTFINSTNLAKPGCDSRCGDLIVPYPFGIGDNPGCYLNEGFRIYFNNSNPPKATINESDYNSIKNISDSTIRLSNTLASKCYNPDGTTYYDIRVFVDFTPFTLSKANKFTAIGCDNFGIMNKFNDLDYESSKSTSCTVYCSRPEDVDAGECTGNGCCQSSIPNGITAYEIYEFNLSAIKNRTWELPCTYAFVGEENVFNFSGVPYLNDPNLKKRIEDNVPIVLEWAIGNLSCSEAATACKSNSVANVKEAMKEIHISILAAKIYGKIPSKSRKKNLLLGRTLVKNGEGQPQLPGSLVGASAERGKKKMTEEEEEVAEEDDPWRPEWSVQRGSRLNNANICRDMLVHLAPPREEKYLDKLLDVEAYNRTWLLVCKAVMSQADLLFWYETLLDSYNELNTVQQTCDKTFKDNWKHFGNMATELKELKDEHAKCLSQEPGELQRLMSEHAECSRKFGDLGEKVVVLEREKQSWVVASTGQKAKISALEKEFEEVKSKLSEEEADNQALRKERTDLAVRMGNVEVDKNRIVNEFIPEMVRHLLNSREYKQTLAGPFNLDNAAGYLDGLRFDRSDEDLEKILANIEDLDLEADEKYPVLFDQLFTTEYPYVQKFRTTISRKFEDLMKVFPEPAPLQLVDPDQQTMVIEPANESSGPEILASNSAAPSHQDGVPQDEVVDPSSV